MEALVEQKLMHMDTVINLYEMLDESVRESLLVHTFERIDETLDEIQKMDILFVTKLDRFKGLNQIRELSELDAVDQKLFKKLKGFIEIAREKQMILEGFEKKYEAIRSELKRKELNGVKQSIAASAYGKINKF
jgi:hypothetical protein